MTELSRKTIAAALATTRSIPSILNPEIDAENVVMPPGVPLPETGFDSAVLLYPLRPGGVNRVRAIKEWIARVKEGCSPVGMTDGIRRYAEHCKSKGINGTHRVMPLDSFLGRRLQFLDAWTATGKPFEPPIPEGMKRSSTGELYL
ncbi:hypothetical protein [Paraburkholderia aromaticivorans]|uniref:hypothetical protein n=1 Tax=Paraburkholderia aromaticivorans TaxID=2026199 RepID=UPI001455F9CC|nr:hypothetical protein [Paraburkholderia aromaticivorans]